VAIVLVVAVIGSGLYWMLTPGVSPVLAQDNFRLLLSDDASEVTAIEEFASVMVTVNKIGFQRGGESGSWIEPEDFEPWTGDLLDLLGTDAAVIWEGYIEPGDYTKAFIYVDNVTGTLTQEAGGGQVSDIKIPSDKLQITKPFAVTADGAEFVFDITVIKAGRSGQYLVKPQVGESGPDQEYVIHEGAGEDEAEIEFKGTISGLDPLVISVDTVRYEVIVDEENTEIEGELAEGLTAKVEGILQEDGSVLALKIEVEEVEDEIEFEGTISTLDPLVIGDYTVVVDENTEIEGELAVDLAAKVEGLLQEDGSVLALEIEVEEVEG